MANNVNAQEILTRALKACPRGNGVQAELRTAVELALRSARSNRGRPNARLHVQEAIAALADPAVDEETRTEVGAQLRDALAYMEGNARRKKAKPAEPESVMFPASRPRAAGGRRKVAPRRAGGGRRKPSARRRAPADARRVERALAPDASPIEAVLERSADGTTTIRVALRPGDLRALVREVLG
jgi:hypothetical protein